MAKTQANEKKRAELEQEAARQQQLLADAQALVAKLQLEQADASKRAAAHAALTSHIAGFYAEIDKLSKGKALFASTDLAVQQINEIVRDAKAIIDGDAYLDRVKEFVPAGENPLYPDILLATRTVQQCLARTVKGIEERSKQASKSLRDAQTVAAGLKHQVETGRQATLGDIQAVMTKPSESWFFEANDGKTYFDIVRVTKAGLGGIGSGPQD